VTAAMPAPGRLTGRIGPNAITRVAEVLPVFVGSRTTGQLFEAAGLADYLQHPPQGMVEEAEVSRLHTVLRARLGDDLAAQVARRAGLRTADYLLANRIPKAVQTLLRALPAALAARVLLTAIRRNAWTFSGSGVFVAKAGLPCVLTIAGNPLCKGVSATEPSCSFYAATFERLFRELVHRDARVVETACEACGAAACCFEVRW